MGDTAQPAAGGFCRYVVATGERNGPREREPWAPGRCLRLSGRDEAPPLPPPSEHR